MKTRTEVEDLKLNWDGDPIWDIEFTEGFEEYRDELLTHRLAREAEWKAAQENELLEKANALGVPGNIQLATYIMGLERKIEILSKQIDWLEERRSKSPQAAFK